MTPSIVAALIGTAAGLALFAVLTQGSRSRALSSGTVQAHPQAAMNRSRQKTEAAIKQNSAVLAEILTAYEGPIQ
jgi:hypothetical protein